MSKFKPMTANLVRSKGAAAAAAPAPAAPAPAVTTAKNLENLGFKVSAEFNEEFRDRAHRDKVKLNELLFRAFEAYKAANP